MRMREAVPTRDLKWLTAREKDHLKEMTPVWISDMKRVMCPEELPEVIRWRKAQEETVSKQTKGRTVSKD